MIMDPSLLSIFCFGTAVGWTMQQCLIVAPTLSKKLDKDSFRKTIRPIWAKFYRGLLAIEAVNAANILRSGCGAMSAHFYIAAASTAICATCIYIIPIMNDASDSSGSEARMTFSRLHNVSVGGTAVLLLGNIVALFL